MNIRNNMKNSVRLLGATLLLLLGITAPAHALDAKGVAPGDTISIQHKETGFFLAANSSEVYAAKDLTTDALWKVVEVTSDGFRLQRIADVGKDQGYQYVYKKLLDIIAFNLWDVGIPLLFNLIHCRKRKVVGTLKLR
ncbi:MAG: hypothetical protein ACI30A_07875 [Paludibacteraceae bacterium]